MLNLKWVILLLNKDTIKLSTKKGRIVLIYYFI